MAVKKHRFFEHINRSILKALTFRVLVLTTNGLTTFLITKRYDLTLGVVLVSNVINTILYIFHERAWNNVHFGKHHHQK